MPPWVQSINVSRWSNKVRAIFGIDGPNPIATLEQLNPVAVIECDRIEWGFAGQERFGGNLVSQPGVAAEFGCIGILNPVGSGVLTVVRLIECVANTTTCNIKIGRITEYVPTAAVDIAMLSNEGREWDMRVAASAALAPRLATTIRRGSNAAQLGLAAGWFTTHQFGIGAGAGSGEMQSFGEHRGRAIVLSEGMVAVIEATVVNTVFQCNIAVRERAQESSRGS